MWEIITPMDSRRQYAAAVVVNEYIYVAGGRSNNALDSVECYDPKTNNWVQLASMNEPREAFALIKSNGFLYAFGGNAVIERYDSWSTCWTKVSASARCSVNTLNI